MKKLHFVMGLAIFMLFCLTSAVFAVDGFASENGGTTGGQGGDTVTVSNAADFQSYVESTSPYIIEVSGIIDLDTVGVDGKVEIRSNKTIKGISPGTTIIGQLGFVDGSSNVIIERLNITAPYSSLYEGDGISIKDEITNVFITKCTFYDCADGCLDVTEQSDYVTLSWCKFYYTVPRGHECVNLIGNDNPDNLGKLHVTSHHNWYDSECNSRMPMVRYGRVHVYNNYYNCQYNDCCVRARVQSECLVENNYFNRVDEPYYSESSGKIKASGNILVKCTNYTDHNDDVFTPPYTYSLDSAINVPIIVQIGAGADGSDTPPSPSGLGAVLCETWTGISGDSVSDLTSNPDFPDNPTTSNQFESLEAPMNYADSYGRRIRGYLHPPADANYTFWIASNDNSELWLSTDGNPANASLIAEVPGWTDPCEWDKYPSDQESSPIYLYYGQKYYIEVLHKEDSGNDNLSAAWEGADLGQQVIHGAYMSPWWSGTYVDITDDDIVDINDLSEFFDLWLEDDCLQTAALDLDGDCLINFYEFSTMAQNWLDGIE